MEETISYDDLEIAKTKAIFFAWELIKFNNPGIKFEELQKKGDLNDGINCIAWNFTDEDGLYVFDWEDNFRIEIIQNRLYTNLLKN